MSLCGNGAHVLLKVSSETSLQNFIPTHTHFLPCPGFIFPSRIPPALVPSWIASGFTHPAGPSFHPKGLRASWDQDP